MLRLPKFQYLKPSTVDEACSLLKKHTGKAKLIAGGTDLLPSMKQRLFTPEQVVDLRQVEGLRGIRNGGGKELSIGSLTTLSAVEESGVIQEKYSALAEAAGLVAAPQIRNMGTLGGNIALDTRCWYFNQSHFWRKPLEVCLQRGGEVCHAVKKSKQCHAYFAADTVPALVALNARIMSSAPIIIRQLISPNWQNSALAVFLLIGWLKGMSRLILSGAWRKKNR